MHLYHTQTLTFTVVASCSNYEVLKRSLSYTTDILKLYGNVFVSVSVCIICDLYMLLLEVHCSHTITGSNLLHAHTEHQCT